MLMTVLQCLTLKCTSGIVLAICLCLQRRGYSFLMLNVTMLRINTLDSIKDKYTVKEYSDSRKAQSNQDIIRCPSIQDHIRYVENNMLLNCPVTKADVLHAEDILRPHLGSLNSKTTRNKLSHVFMNTCNELPKGMLVEHGNITLAVDIMNIIEILFVTTTSLGYTFRNS